MIKSFKDRFYQNWKIFKEAKTRIDFSKLDADTWRDVGQWPVTTNPFFPLTTSCIVRNEKEGYLLLYRDAILKVNELTISVLEMCDGFTTPKEIKKRLKESLSYTVDNSFEEQIEKILSSSAKFGIILWMPFGQPHLDRMRKLTGGIKTS